MKKTNTPIFEENNGNLAILSNNLAFNAFNNIVKTFCIFGRRHSEKAGRLLRLHMTVHVILCTRYSHFSVHLCSSFWKGGTDRSQANMQIR